MIWLASIFSLVLRVSLLFPPLKVNWAFREGGGRGVRQWTLVRDIFGQKQTDAFSSILRHVWSSARDIV